MSKFNNNNNNNNNNNKNKDRLYNNKDKLQRIAMN